MNFELIFSWIGIGVIIILGILFVRYIVLGDFVEDNLDEFLKKNVRKRENLKNE